MLRILLISLAGLLFGLLALVYGIHRATDSVSLDADALDGMLRDSARIPEFAASTREPCRDRNPLKKAYFGGLHIHTGLSGDAGAWGVAATPDDAYRFARGGELEVRLRGETPGSAPRIRLPEALDFAAVTDHAEYLGETSLCYDPEAKAHDSLVCRVYRGELRLPVEESMQPMARLVSFALFRSRVKAICGDDGALCLERAQDIWLEQQAAAERAYDRSEDCKFTSFVGYEYSLAKERANLHRNVIFANAAVPPSALSAREAREPEQLWRWLDETCSQSGAGCEAIAIPHNSNWSSGRMFYPYHLQAGDPGKQRELAALRQRYEPLAEVMQVKGDSECRNGLSRVIGQPDEYCDFEKLRHPDEVAQDCGDGVGSGGMTLSGCLSRYSFVRYAQIEGLREEELLGVNSLKLGVIAATDTHIAAPGAVAEDDFPGSTGLDRTALEQLREPTDIPGLASADITRYNPGGLAGIWAEENSRESLFAAMKRRETFGTSGPRILPRFFGGWRLDPALCSAPDVIATAYREGVPMGSDLPAPDTPGVAPSFLVTATMDAASGAVPLQKIQIIKGWIDSSGDMHQQVLDVAGDAGAAASVDPQTCERSGAGHTQLCSVWRDEHFDPAQSAVYYARVLENPSCRWTSHQCNRLSDEERPALCEGEAMQRTVQERAWTSPIFYRAAGDAG